jgi:hypothetical protein
VKGVTWRVVNDSGGRGQPGFRVVYDAQIERRQTPTLDLGIMGHSTDSADSVPG